MGTTITGCSEFHPTQDVAIAAAVRDLRSELASFTGEYDTWECWGLNVSRREGFGYTASVLLRDYTLTDDDATWAGDTDLAELLNKEVSAETFASSCHWYEAAWVMGDKEAVDA